MQLSEKGVCNFCEWHRRNREILENEAARREIFEKEVTKAKEQAAKNGARYDCLVGFSGGKDSTYIIYQMKHRYQMRVLAFTMDQGFVTDYGRENIRRALEILEVEHVTIRPPEAEMWGLYRQSVKLLKNFCGVCFHLMHYYSYLLAGSFGIPLIVNGRTKGQIYQRVQENKGIEPFEISRKLLDFERQMFGRLPDMLKARGRVDYLEDVEAAALSYFAYHDVTEEETMAFLEKHLNWRRPPEGVAHGDCWAHPLAEAFSMEKTGYPVNTGELAVQVRFGERTREESLRIREKEARLAGKVPEARKRRFYDCLAGPDGAKGRKNDHTGENK